MELNREQIIKALECCLVESNCTGCPLHRQHETDCLKYIGVKALALIKELTEENERLRAYINRCKSGEEYWVKCLIDRADETKADTVRKMQERFIAEIEQTPNANEHFIKVWKSKIDQIAKEMIGEGND